MTDQLKRAISAAKTAQANDPQAEATRIASSSAGDQTFDMSESSYKTSHTAIRKARRFALQGLYEWLVTDRRFDIDGKLGWKANAPHDIAARTRATNAMHTVHIGYYHEMMRDIPEQIEALDALISQHLDREIDKLDTVEHAILLIGAYELQNRFEIPYKVVLDEAMKLNNHFGATDAHKLINAVLDRMAVELRVIEVEADTKANKRTSQKVAVKQPDATPVEATENAIETDIDNQPTASNKPRISANNAGVKRNRPNKANANISEFKASKRDAAQNVMAQDNIEPESIEKDTNEENLVINEESVVENVAGNDISNDSISNENADTTVADIGLHDSNIVSEETKQEETTQAEAKRAELDDTDTDTKTQD